jgi:membrane-associated phospholipid phosphatase
MGRHAMLMLIAWFYFCRVGVERSSALLLVFGLLVNGSRMIRMGLMVTDF